MKLIIKTKTTSSGKNYYVLSYGSFNCAISPAFGKDKDGNVNKAEWAKFFQLIEVVTATQGDENGN